MGAPERLVQPGSRSDSLEISNLLSGTRRGNALAEGCSDPFLQKSGFSMPRTEAANHTLPLSSNMLL